jgi:hypothetical protein
MGRAQTAVHDLFIKEEICMPARSKLLKGKLVIRSGLLISALMLLLSAGVVAQSSAPQATASMSDLMTRMVQPLSDAIFYVSRTPPDSDAAWRELENRALMLAESANLLLIPGYVQPGEQWLRDALTMRDASVAAFQAASGRDLDALMDLNNDLYESCESCHTATR